MIDLLDDNSKQNLDLGADVLRYCGKTENEIKKDFDTMNKDDLLDRYELPINGLKQKLEKEGNTNI